LSSPRRAAWKLAASIVEDLQAALEQFAAIADDLSGKAEPAGD
jgi:hypothetical protein